MQNVDNSLVTFLVLGFRKPEADRLCLGSIKARAKVPHKVVYLDNGGGMTYPWNLYQEGLCDELIVKRRGEGGGVGQIDLFRWCDTKYAFYVQSDQILARDITSEILDSLIQLLEGGYRVCDLNGDQSNRGVWSDRAHFIDVGFFNSLAPHSRGGPGPLHEIRWLENYMQEVFARPENKIAHIKPVFFADNGRTTVRELPCGGIVSMATDTKAVSWVKPPSSPYVFPDMTPAEWETAIAGAWQAGTIPEGYLKRGESFRCWRDVKL